MTTVLIIAVLAGAATVVGFVRTTMRLGRLEPGLERAAAVNSLWSLGGSAGIVLMITMSIPPFTTPLGARLGVLGGAAVLSLIGGVRNRRLAAARQESLLQAWESAATLADQLDALEGQRLQYRKIPLRFAVLLMSGKVVAAATCLSVLRFIRDPILMALFGAFAALNIGWLAWDVVASLRRKAGRDRIDQRIAALLGSHRISLPEGGEKG